MPTTAFSYKLNYGLSNFVAPKSARDDKRTSLHSELQSPIKKSFTQTLDICTQNMHTYISI